MLQVRVINGYSDGWTGEGITYIGRHNSAIRQPGSPLGNPFRIGKDGNRDNVVAKYRTWLADRVAEGMAGQSNRQYEELRHLADAATSGKEELEELRLACYCKPQACHGDVVRDWIHRLAEDASFSPSNNGA